jgi:hypothetical protein
MACVHGYRVLYRTSAQLLADLTASLADKTLPARLRRYANPDLLIIDEFGFDKIERAECPEAAHLLYKIIASRNQNRSTALVTNVDFDKWGDHLSDGPLAMAFLDRLVEEAIIPQAQRQVLPRRKGESVGKPFLIRKRNLPKHRLIAAASVHRGTNNWPLSHCQNGPFPHCHRHTGLCHSVPRQAERTPYKLGLIKHAERVCRKLGVSVMDCIATKGRSTLLSSCLGATAKWKAKFIP